MLPELVLYALTSAPRRVRAMGLVTESIGLWSRGSRRRADWEDHGRRCRAVVLAAAQGLARRRTAVVLGSGLVRDVPIGALITLFERVMLVDAVHLPMVRLRFARSRVVKLVSADLSGAAAVLAGERPDIGPPLAILDGVTDIDLVVSANLLSQLPIGIETWLDNNPGPRADALAGLPSQVVGAHLDALSGLPCRVCLLTDVEMREEDRKGVVLDRLDLLHGHVLPMPDASWDWPVAPFGEIARDRRFIHRVHAYNDFSASRH